MRNQALLIPIGKLALAATGFMEVGKSRSRERKSAYIFLLSPFTVLMSEWAAQQDIVVWQDKIYTVIHNTMCFLVFCHTFKTGRKIRKRVGRLSFRGCYCGAAGLE